MAHVVTADAIVVLNSEGQQHLLHKGAELPDFVDNKKAKELRDAGLVETTRRSSSAAAAQGEKPHESRQSTASQAPAGHTPPDPTVFDPTDASAEDVVAHLGAADAAEVARVKAAEAAGKARKTIADWEPAPSGDGEK